MKPFFHRVPLGVGAGVLMLAGCAGKEPAKITPPVQQAAPPALPTTVAAAPVATPTPEPPKPDPVVGMIAEAEAAYQSGRANYQAGHLDAAKQDFNRSVDILMSGPVDVKAEDRLRQEFDKVTEEIHKLEMEAFKEGDGFTAQQPEPAPIDEANKATFPVDPNVKAQAEAQLRTTQSDLPLMINDYVAGYINYFSSNGKGSFERAWVRSGRYRDMILRIFKEEGVPQDLIYLAQAESGFIPLAVSRAGARGMWQFMASRGVGYGLQRSWWQDDRQDPEKATRAAARHLKDLYAQFGDWYLAMAAYNSGPGNVQQAVRRTGYADFWELYKRDVLPKETKNYVPIILAMTIMSKNPAQYGLDRLAPDASWTYDTVAVDYPVDLRLVAECVDAPVERLAELNPSLVRHITPRDRSFDLRLPEGTRDKYLEAITGIPKDKRVLWRYYKIESGDTLAGVARKYHTTERAIASANNLEGRELKPEERLVIPITGPVPGEGGAVAYSKHPTRYKVRKGDTVLSVADDFGVPPDRLRRWNHLKGNHLSGGASLVIYHPLAPGEREPASAKKRSGASHKKKTTAGGTTAARPATKKPAKAESQSNSGKPAAGPASAPSTKTTLAAGAH